MTVTESSTVTEADIRRVARRIGEAADADRVILYGSHARGTATPDSDVDLLVIAENDLPRHQRSRELHRLLESRPFPLDILVFTPGEVARNTATRVSFLSGIMEAGKTVYARGDSDCPEMGGEGPHRSA